MNNVEAGWAGPSYYMHAPRGAYDLGVVGLVADHAVEAPEGGHVVDHEVLQSHLSQQDDHSLSGDTCHDLYIVVVKGPVTEEILRDFDLYRGGHTVYNCTLHFIGHLVFVNKQTNSFLN